MTGVLRAGRPLAFVLALAVLAWARTPAEVAALPAEPVRLAVVTWNMHAGLGDLPRLVRDLENGLTGAPARDLVLLLQEAVHEELPPLDDAAPGREWSIFFAPVHADGARTRGNAILSTRPIDGARAIALPRERQPRGAAAGAIAVDGHELFVVSAHLENRVSWWKAVVSSDDARGRQAEALLKALPPGAPGIVGGDFNTWLGPDERAWRLLATRFDDTPRSDGTPTLGPLLLDHVFVDLPYGWRASTRVVEDRYGSDHHPVIASIED